MPPKASRQGRAKLDASTARELKARLAAVVAAEPFGKPSVAAAKLGVDERTVRAWCSKSGQQVPDFPFLVRLCQMTGLSLNWLVLGVGPQRTSAVADGSLEGAVASYVADQVAQRRGLTAPVSPDEDGETESPPRGSVVSADGAGLLAVCVEKALESFDATLNMLRQRAVMMRAAEELAGVGSMLPKVARQMPPSAARAINREAERLRAALIDALPEPKGARPLACFSDTAEGARLLEKTTRAVDAKSRRRFSVFPEIRRELEAMVHHEDLRRPRGSAGS